MTALLCEFRNQDKRHGFGFFKADAALAHVQFPFHAVCVFSGKPRQKPFIGIDAHVVHCNEILLRRNADEWQGLLRIAVIPLWVKAVGNSIANHSIADRFGKAYGKVLIDYIAQLLHVALTVVRERLYIFLRVHPDFFFKNRKC